MSPLARILPQLESLTVCRSTAELEAHPACPPIAGAVERVLA
jgi:hypothetical protein